MQRREQDHPRAVVGAFVVNAPGELLLVKSPKWKQDWWIVPGGHVEHGESIAKAVVREVREETGLPVAFKEVFMVNESIFSKAFARKRHFVFLECLCRVRGKREPRLDGRELTEYVWAKPRAALRMRLEPGTRKSIKKLLEKKL